MAPLPVQRYLKHVLRWHLFPLVKLLFDVLSSRPSTFALQLELAQEIVDWARSKHKTYLRINLEIRLAKMYLGRVLKCVDCLKKRTSPKERWPLSLHSTRS